jgi:hypothetical protein
LFARPIFTKKTTVKDLQYEAFALFQITIQIVDSQFATHSAGRDHSGQKCSCRCNAQKGDRDRQLHGQFTGQHEYGGIFKNVKGETGQEEACSSVLHTAVAAAIKRINATLRFSMNSSCWRQYKTTVKDLSYVCGHQGILVR